MRLRVWHVTVGGTREYLYDITVPSEADGTIRLDRLVAAAFGRRA